MYLWNNNLSNVLQDRNNANEFIPYSITKYNQHLLNRSNTKNKYVKGYNNITILPINRYRELPTFIKRKMKCKIPFHKCIGYDNSIPYYSLPNIYH